MLSPRPNHSLEVGDRLWVPCDRLVWRAGIVVGCSGACAAVKLQGGGHHEHVVIDVPPAGSEGGPPFLMRSGGLLSPDDAKTVEDLSLLPLLAEPEVLHLLHMRFLGQSIYTLAGPMLLAVNPYKEVDGLHDNEKLFEFAGTPQGCPPPRPHIFGIARDAFLGIQHSNESQTVLISGESGSGKTESAKHVLRFLALAGDPRPDATKGTVEKRVLESTLLLQALGNARTSKNDNSSRAGSFMELRFQRKAKALGPCIKDVALQTYLLETFRVTNLGEGERCFHIFYQVLAAATRGRTMVDQVAAESGDVNGGDGMCLKEMVRNAHPKTGDSFTSEVSESTPCRTPTEMSPQRVGRTTGSFSSNVSLDGDEASNASTTQRLRSRRSRRNMSDIFPDAPNPVKAVMNVRRKPGVESGVSHVVWDHQRHYWVVTWARQQKEHTKTFSPASFFMQGATVDDADTQAFKAAVTFRNQLVARGRIQAPPLPLSLSVPGLALPDVCEWMPRQFAFLARSSCEVLPGDDDAKEFDRTLKAMQALQIENDEILQLVSIIVAILHLGNIRFQSPQQNTEGSEVVDGKDLIGPLCLASVFLGVDSEDLSTALCTHVIQVQGKSTKQLIRKSRTAEQAAGCRDALARHLYSVVFEHIVSRMNEALAESVQIGEAKHGSGPLCLPSIGVLDLFGFETCDCNCLEQFCINFANEMLQEHFAKAVFEHELAFYQEQGIPLDLGQIEADVARAMQCNSDIRSLVDCIVPLLDDECLVPGSACDSWLYKVGMAMSYSSNSTFQMVHDRTGHFQVQHFAGLVEYNGHEFRAKKKDTVSAEVLECIQASSKTVLKQQSCSYQRRPGTMISPRSGRVVRVKSAASVFRDQLGTLLKRIQATRSRFVHCIKPNRSRKADEFDCCMVLRQLRNHSVLEATRVASAGYAMRLSHRQAVQTYWSLAPTTLRKQLEQQMRCDMQHEAIQALLSHFRETLPGLPLNGIQVGNTLTFFKTAAIEILGAHVRRYRERGAVRVQTFWRRRQCTRQFGIVRCAILKLQTSGRALSARKRTTAMRRERHACAALRLQSVERGRRARLECCKRRHAIVALQAWARGRQQRIAFEQLSKATLDCQRWVRKRISAKKAASSRSRATRQLSRIRCMVQDTMTRLDSLDLDHMDSRNGSVFDAISSVERASSRLCRKAGRLDECQKQGHREVTASSLTETQSSSCHMVPEATVESFTVRDPDAELQASESTPWVPLSLGTAAPWAPLRGGSILTVAPVPPRQSGYPRHQADSWWSSVCRMRPAVCQDGVPCRNGKVDTTELIGEHANAQGWLSFMQDESFPTTPE